MEGDKERGPPDIVTVASGQSADEFYEKLSELYEFSGLSLLFNFRKTILDLYLFYKAVTARGGFHQVSKDGKWDDVMSALNLDSSIPKLPFQLQKLYANLLYRFEQIYFCRKPLKPVAASGNTLGTGESSIGKRKHLDSSSQWLADNSSIEDGLMVERKCNNNSSQLLTGCRTPEQKLALPTPSKTKETKKDPNAPLGMRSAYQIFLKEECVRLRKLHGENQGGQTFRKMAIDAWRCLSEKDRQPYIEESRKDKVRYYQETAAYKQHQWNLQDPAMQNGSSNSKASANKHGMPSQTAGDYQVTLQPDAKNFLALDESMAELAIRFMKNAQSSDPVLQINWDDYCGSLDIPS